MSTTYRKKVSRKRKPLGREAWLEAARLALTEEGTAGIEINKLAKRLGVSSRSGFYWFFKDRQALLDELLSHWATSTLVLFERLIQQPGSSGTEQYHALIRLWIDESDYDPKWDGAIRDWGRTSSAVQKEVEKVDDQRIAVIEQIFQNIGYRGMDAHIRARVTYYHQVGYYALGIREPRKLRLELIPYYARVLIGPHAPDTT